MLRPLPSGNITSLYPPVVKSPAILVGAILWLLFAVGLPFYQLREARRQAHQDLQHVAVVDKSAATGLIAAFDRANQKLDTALSGPCLILAFTTLLLVYQLLNLKRRCHAVPPDYTIAGPGLLG